MVLDCLHEADSTAVKAWDNHPVVLMWRGYEVHLSLYGLAMLGEWLRRGKDADNAEKRLNWHYDTATMPDDFKMEKPPWMEDEYRIQRVERVSRSLLIARDLSYTKLWPDTPKNLTPYFPRADEE
jgi:hypothetical protein